MSTTYAATGRGSRMADFQFVPLRGWAHPAGAGIRHQLLVIPSVICAAQASLTIVEGVGLHRTIVGRGQRAEFVGIQQAGGTGAAIRAGREALDRLRAAAASDREVTFGWAELRIGVEAAWLGLAPAQARVFSSVI